MTAKAVKEFLQQAYLAQQEIDMKLEEIIRLQSLATRTTSTIRGTPSGSKAANSKIENAIVNMKDRIERFSEEISELSKVIETVSDAISKVQNPIEKKILQYRYLHFFSWKQIALRMKTSLRYVYILHENALKNFPVVQ